MELILMPECRHIERIQATIIEATAFFEKSIIDLELHSLQKIIITGADSIDYYTALQRYGGELDSHITVTNDNGLDGCAVTIHGIASNGKFEQIIFIKDFLFAAFSVRLLYANDFSQLPFEKAQINLGLHYISHEFGHALECQTSYVKYGYHAPCKTFNLPYEYETFVQHQAMLLWSEYFAERFATSVTPQVNDSLNDIIEYLNSTIYEKKLNKQLKHSYRVAYFLAHYLASLHQQEKELPLLNDIEEYSQIAGYQEIFGNISDTLYDLFLHNGEWIFMKDSMRLAEAYNRLISYERELYS